MNTKSISSLVRLAVCSGLLAGVTSSRATTMVGTETTVVSPGMPYQLETVAFSDSAEAGMMHRAYRILATGDHDYDGHRVKAMKEVKAAADLLGLDLRGDAKDHERQVLSDDKMREAKDLLHHVLDNAEVKRQKRITKHVAEAIHQIDVALVNH